MNADYYSLIKLINLFYEEQIGWRIAALHTAWLNEMLIWDFVWIYKKIINDRNSKKSWVTKMF